MRFVIVLLLIGLLAFNVMAKSINSEHLEKDYHKELNNANPNPTDQQPEMDEYEQNKMLEEEEEDQQPEIDEDGQYELEEEEDQQPEIDGESDSKKFIPRLID